METDASERAMIPTSAARGEGPPIQLQRLARWACGLTFEDLPADVVERAKVVLMDDPGAILGGSLEPEVTAIAGSGWRWPRPAGRASWRRGCHRSTLAPPRK